jgi:hypothetical protein
MDKTRFWILLGILITFSFCNVAGSQIIGSESIDDLSWYANRADLIVYGKTSDVEVKWVENNILTLSQIQVYEIFKQNSSLNFTVGSFVPIYVRGGRIDDPVQAAAHHGIGREYLDGEMGIGSNRTFVYFITKRELGYHLIYVEDVDPDSDFFRSNFTTLKYQVSEILQGHPVPERTPKPKKNN